MARVEEGWQNKKENMKPTKAGSGVGTPHPPACYSGLIPQRARNTLISGHRLRMS